MENAPKNTAEKASLFLRNLNIVGAIALGGAGVILESSVLTTLGVINAGQAGFFELTRRWAGKNNTQSPQQRLSPA